MEYRKLISFGKSSFVVSLPKTWVVKQKLKKGDLIYFDEKENELILNSRLKEDEEDQKEIVIEVDGKELKQIRREIIAAYIKNNKTITLLGNEIKTKAKDIQPMLQGLVALEVMEQTAKKIVARDFLNLEDVAIDNIIKKVDIIIRAMLSDCENMFEEDTYESIDYRDNDINKLVFLIFRIVKYGFEYPSYASKKFRLTASELSSVWWMACYLECVADEIKRIARKMKSIKLTKQEKQRYKKLFIDIKDSYLKIMKAYYTADIKKVHEVINSREELIQRCDQFYLDNKGVFNIGFMIDKTKSLVVHICHLGRILYQG